MNGHRLAAVLVAASFVGGCGGPEVLVASSIAQAAIETGIDEAKRQPPPSLDDAWRDERFALLAAHAERGDAAAQYRLALVYAAARDRRAYGWMCRAAVQDLPRAQLQLGHWLNEDRLREDLWPYLPVAPDDARALHWYRLAAQHGQAGAAAFRDEVAARAPSESSGTTDCGSPLRIGSSVGVDAGPGARAGN